MAKRGADVVVIAEVLEDQNKRPAHGTYYLVWNSKYISVYPRKDRLIQIKAQGSGEWVLTAAQHTSYSKERTGTWADYYG